MGFINFIAELLKDPRTAIASWIAAGPAPHQSAAVSFVRTADFRAFGGNRLAADVGFLRIQPGCHHQGNGGGFG